MAYVCLDDDVRVRVCVLFCVFVLQTIKRSGSQEAPRRPQNVPGGPRKPTEAPGSAKRSQEAPRDLRMPQEAPEAPGGPQRAGAL